ncbi:MAG: hypothetical protein ABI813_06730 [Bacteroidota bacterium]
MNTIFGCIVQFAFANLQDIARHPAAIATTIQTVILQVPVLPVQYGTINIGQPLFLPHLLMDETACRQFNF